ncbi:hypothetical protein D3C87_2126480 [compost metagenome]
MVSRYQAVALPSVAESGRPIGYSAILASLIAFAAASNSSGVFGAAAMPALSR